MSETIFWKLCPNCGDVSIRYDPVVKQEFCEGCGLTVTFVSDPVVCGAPGASGGHCQNAAGHRPNGGRDNDGHYYVVYPERPLRLLR